MNKYSATAALVLSLLAVSVSTATTTIKGTGVSYDKANLDSQFEMAQISMMATRKKHSMPIPQLSSGNGKHRVMDNGGVD
jgi:hypothetical protein